MATLQDYIDVAPTVMQDLPFTLEQIENKLSQIPDPPPPPEPPVITTQKKRQLFDMVFNEVYTADEGVSKAKGYARIANQLGLWPEQVKLLVREFKKMVIVHRTVE